MIELFMEAILTTAYYLVVCLNTILAIIITVQIIDWLFSTGTLLKDLYKIYKESKRGNNDRH